MDTGTPTTTPPLSPSTSMATLIRPPTHGGGPLSSHPTTPVDMPGAWISTSDLPSQSENQTCTPPLSSLDTPPSSASPSVVGGVEPKRTDSFRTPLEPASANIKRRGSKGIRKLLSLSSIRNSFLGGGGNAGSRSSSLNISLPIPKTSAGVEEHGERLYSRASSAHYPQGIKRSASPSVSSSCQNDISEVSTSPLHQRKSASWFRRKSQIFLSSTDDDSLAGAAETQDKLRTNHGQEMETKDDEEGYEEREVPKSEDFRSPRQTYEPPQRYQYYERPQSHQPGSRPQSYHSSRTISCQSIERPQTYTSLARPKSVMLPELDTLAGGSFSGGSFGGDDMFANIGQ